MEAARTLGVPGESIMLRHIWPNVSAIGSRTASLSSPARSSACRVSRSSARSRPQGTAGLGSHDCRRHPTLVCKPDIGARAGRHGRADGDMYELIGDWLYDYLSSRGATR